MLSSTAPSHPGPSCPRKLLPTVQFDSEAGPGDRPEPFYSRGRFPVQTSPGAPNFPPIHAHPPGTPTLPAWPSSTDMCWPQLHFLFFFFTTPFTTLTLQVHHLDWDSWNLPHALAVLSRSLYLCSCCPCPSASLHLSKSDPPSQTWYRVASFVSSNPPPPPRQN